MTRLCWHKKRRKTPPNFLCENGKAKGREGIETRFLGLSTGTQKKKIGSRYANAAPPSHVFHKVNATKTHLTAALLSMKKSFLVVYSLVAALNLEKSGKGAFFRKNVRWHVNWRAFSKVVHFLLAWSAGKFVCSIHDDMKRKEDFFFIELSGKKNFRWLQQPFYFGEKFSSPTKNKLCSR